MISQSTGELLNVKQTTNDKSSCGKRGQISYTSSDAGKSALFLVNETVVFCAVDTYFMAPHIQFKVLNFAGAEFRFRKILYPQTKDKT